MLFTTCIFLQFGYNIKQRFCATVAALAPNMDLQLIKNLISYEVIDIHISKSVLKKMCGQLWYLTPEVTSLAFFDGKVSSQTMLKQRSFVTLNQKEQTFYKQMKYKIMQIKILMNYINPVQ